MAVEVGVGLGCGCWGVFDDLVTKSYYISNIILRLLFQLQVMIDGNHVVSNQRELKCECR